MFFAHFITTWIDKRNKFHPPTADSNVSDAKKDGRPGQKKSYLNTQMDGHHCNLLPHPVWQRESNRPPAQSPPYCCISLIKCFAHLRSKEMVFKYEIILSISPF